MSGLTAREFSAFASKCAEIGNELADEGGFVSARGLVSRFGAELILRPLLVEGMLASVERDEHQDGGVGLQHKWAVLIDNESYVDVSEADIRNESVMNPLPSRMRNTIAHELVHSLAFRSTEFGVELTRFDESQKSRRALIAAIEQETEKLSPFLLIPESSLDAQLAGCEENFSVDVFEKAMRNMGVSRYVLVNRLNLLRTVDNRSLLNRRALRNTAVGIGEWLSPGEARLKDWPLFLNFNRNVIPEFLLKLCEGKLVTLDGVFADPSFCLCGGTVRHSTTLLHGGTLKVPRAEKMRVRCSVESCARRERSTFLFLVRSF